MWFPFRRSVGANDFEAVREAAVGADDHAIALPEAGANLDGVAMAVAERHDAFGDPLAK